jgi:ubiquinone/menaquinone biosynthesis C-methylase UbiE
MFDVIIAGGDPAGLQAALVLGRARPWVLLCDAAEPRNAVTGVMHGFISRDGADPAQLRATALSELSEYPTVETRDIPIRTASPQDGGFAVAPADDRRETAHKLILATGVVDWHPAIPGLEGLWGSAVFQCPYCDGYERSDQPLALTESTDTASLQALGVHDWSADAVLCTNGPSELTDEDRFRLSAAWPSGPRGANRSLRAQRRWSANPLRRRLLARAPRDLHPSTDATALRPPGPARMQNTQGSLGRDQRLRPNQRARRLRRRRHRQTTHHGIPRRPSHPRRNRRRHRRRRRPPRADLERDRGAHRPTMTNSDEIPNPTAGQSTGAHTEADASDRVRRYYDQTAGRYDRQIKLFERLLLANGRQWACSQATGEVLELAMGTGRNLRHYPDEVRLTGIELSPAMLALAQREAATVGRVAELREGDAQALPFPEESFDTVTCTLSLCTIPDDRAAIREAHRVLRRGGRFILLEHVRSPIGPVRAVQRLLEPLFLRFGHDYLTRDPVDHLEATGFEIERVNRLKWGIVERAIARKPDPRAQPAAARHP